jgi:hypothetical protein
VRATAALTACALLGALAAFALPHAGRAANPTLNATVNDDYTITLQDSHGYAVTNLPGGMYDIVVHDNSAFHNFHLTGPGVDQSTTVLETTTVTWTVNLTAGSYHFKCDVHFPTMYGDFTVGTTTTSTATTTTPASTAPPTTAPTEPTTTAPTTTSGPAEPCVVPRLVGTTLPVARRRLARTSCRLGRISRAYSRQVRRRRIISQRPRAGRRVGYGTAVNVVLSRGRRH